MLSKGDVHLDLRAQSCLVTALVMIWQLRGMVDHLGWVSLAAKHTLHVLMGHFRIDRTPGIPKKVFSMLILLTFF